MQILPWMTGIPRRGRCLFWLLVQLVFAASPVFAEDPALNEETEKYGIVNLQLENDLWGRGTDRHYTHGTRISFLTKAHPTEFSGDVKNWVEDHIPDYFLPDTGRIGFILGQNLFTPENIRKEELIPDDRPYAAWLYIGVGLVAEKTSGARPYLDNLEINVGVVGPAALGEETQTEVHRIKDVQIPNGWRHQLDNEFGFLISYERKWPFRYKPEGFLDYDLTPSLGATLGNVYTYLSTGFTVRMGNDLPSDYGPPRIRPGLSGSGFFKPSNRFGWYIFAGVEGRLVGRNIFLDGNTFADSHSVSKEIFVGDLQAGVVVTLFRDLRLGFTNIFRTTEFKKQKEGDEFGSIFLSYRW